MKLCVSQTRKLCWYLLLTVHVSSFGLASILTSIVSLEDPLECLKSLFRVHSGRFHSYSKKKKEKLAKMTTHCHLLSFVVIYSCLLWFVVTCHLLSLVFSCCYTWHSLCHLLSFVVSHCDCTTHCDLSLVVTHYITRLYFHKWLFNFF